MSEFFYALPRVSEVGNPMVVIHASHVGGEIEWPIEVGYGQSDHVDSEVLAAFANGVNLVTQAVEISLPPLARMNTTVLDALHDAQRLASEFRSSHGLEPLPAIS